MRRSGHRPHDRAGATTQETKQGQLGRSILNDTEQKIDHSAAVYSVTFTHELRIDRGLDPLTQYRSCI